MSEKSSSHGQSADEQYLEAVLSSQEGDDMVQQSFEGPVVTKQTPRLIELANQVMDKWDEYISEEYPAALLTFALQYTDQDTSQAEPQSVWEDAVVDMGLEMRAWGWDEGEVRDGLVSVLHTALERLSQIKR